MALTALHSPLVECAPDDRLRDEAIAFLVLGLMDCFASLAMLGWTVRYTPPPSRGALRPSFANSFASKNRGRRESRVPDAPAASCAKCRKHTSSHHRFTGTPGIPCAMVLTAYFVLSPVTGLCCHRRPQEVASRELDTSVGVSGPHDFAVRVSAVSSASLALARVHRIPCPTSVTIAKRPSGGTGWRGYSR